MTSEQDQNLIDILGFDPSGKSALKHIPHTSTEELLSENFPFPAPPDIVEHPDFDQAFFTAAIAKLGLDTKRYRYSSRSLFTVVDDGFKEVTRRYHHYDPDIALPNQEFPLTNFIVFERLPRWGGFSLGEPYRIMRVGLNDVNTGSTQLVQFSEGGEVLVELSGELWGDRTQVLYEGGKLKEAKTRGKNFLHAEDFFDRREPFCKLEGKDADFMIPNYLTHPLPVELFNTDFSLEESPFDSAPGMDASWKGKSINTTFGISAVPKS